MSLYWDIEVFEELPSTQDVCNARALGGAVEGTLVQALQQSAGKGRHGREWTFADGNLAVSFILRPECDAKLVGQISIMVGVALAHTIGSAAILKWPNDVLLGTDKSTGKCAGILIDSDLDGGIVASLVVGVGVNTASAPGIGAALNVDRDTFLKAFLDNMDEYYSLWQEGGFEDIRQEWLARSFEKGTKLSVGLFEGMDEWGNLIVQGAANTLKTISAGDVYLKDEYYATGH